MKIRAKTRRRLLWLALGVVSATIAAGSFVAVRKVQTHQRIAAARALGLQAFQAADYAGALAQFSYYLTSHPTDVEALICYAKSRQRVEELDNVHLLQAVGLWRRIADLQPGNVEAQKELLDLYVKVGFSSETLSLADSILAQNGVDAQAWRAKTVALLRLRRFSEARSAADLLMRLAPDDLESYLLALSVLVQIEGGKGDPLAFADRHSKMHPDDSRFEIIESIAHSLSGDRAGALSWAAKASAHPNLPESVLPILVSQLDNLEQFSESARLLERSAIHTQDIEAQRQFTSRLFQSQRWGEVVAHTQTQVASSDDAYLLALRSLSLERLGRHDDARAAVELLSRKSASNRMANTWSQVLSAAFFSPQMPPKSRLSTCRDGQSIYPQDPYLNWFLGQAYKNAGERDLALEAFVRVCRLAPAWGEPWREAAQLQLAIGRTADAYRAAQSACHRMPDDRDAQVTLALAWGAILESQHASETSDVLGLLRDIEKRWPDEVRILPLHVQMLVRNKRKDQAIQLAEAILARTPAADESVLLQLAMISRETGLRLESRALETSEKAHGMTPDLAFAEALHALRDGNGAAGLSILERARAAAGTNAALSWTAVWATYLDITDDPRAEAQWVALGDGHPDDIGLQWSALSARSVQHNNAFVGRTIDRLRDQLGDQGLTWRFARARWLLEARSGEQSAAEASLLLGDIARSSPDLLAPRLLLAECMERLGNVSEAAENLKVAAGLRPDSNAIAIELARLLLLTGDSSQSMDYAEKAARSENATPQERYHAAIILAQLGKYDRALAIIEGLYRGNEQPADLVLAKLYRQQNQLSRAEAICQKLLEKPTPAAIQFAADLYASEGKMADSEAAIAKLDATDAPVAVREIVRGEYFVRVGKLDRGLEAYAAATAADPKNPAAWRERIAVCFSVGQFAQALDILNDAHRAIPTEPILSLAFSNTEMMRDFGDNPAYRPLLASTVRGNSENIAAIEAIRILQDGRNSKAMSAQILPKCYRLATQYPRALAVQSLVIQMYVSAGNVDDAIALATRAMQAFPGNAEPARLATSSLAAASRWSEMLGTAKEWRQRTLGQTVLPDMAIAGAELELGQAQEAVRQLAPHLTLAEAAPDQHAGVILLYARALLKTRQYEKAAALLSPMLQTSSEWRKVWMTLASEAIRDHTIAKTWLEQIADRIPQSGVTEQIGLAHAWKSLGKHYNIRQYTARGNALFESLGSGNEAGADAILALAMNCESEHSLAAAEDAYRRFLRLKPDSDVAKNNLANVLRLRDGDLTEALKLVTEAIAAAPRVPNYYDTRAAILARQNNFQQAAESLQYAVDLSPSDVEWRVNLIANLARSGQKEKAKAALRQLEGLPQGKSLTPEQQEKLSAIGL